MREWAWRALAPALPSGCPSPTLHPSAFFSHASRPQHHSPTRNRCAPVRARVSAPARSLLLPSARRCPAAAIFYALVARKNVVLAEFTGRTGNFPTVTRTLLAKIPEADGKQSYLYDTCVRAGRGRGRSGCWGARLPPPRAARPLLSPIFSGAPPRAPPPPSLYAPLAPLALPPLAATPFTTVWSAA
jgi:hypothetical protein